jgi:uncharacterized protein YndB with AHSA1/START domain
MPDILHRLSIEAPRERVHHMLATKADLEQWWTARPVEGDERAERQARVLLRPP